MAKGGRRRNGLRSRVEFEKFKCSQGGSVSCCRKAQEGQARSHTRKKRGLGSARASVAVPCSSVDCATSKCGPGSICGKEEIPHALSRHRQVQYTTRGVLGIDTSEARRTLFSRA